MTSFRWILKTNRELFKKIINWLIKIVLYCIFYVSSKRDAVLNDHFSTRIERSVLTFPTPFNQSIRSTRCTVHAYKHYLKHDLKYKHPGTYTCTNITLSQKQLYTCTIMVPWYHGTRVRTYTRVPIGTRVRTNITLSQKQLPMVHVYHGTKKWYQW